MADFESVFKSYIAPPVLIAGGLNWIPAVFGAKDNFVSGALKMGESKVLEQIVYALVGAVAALYAFFYLKDGFESSKTEYYVTAWIASGALVALLAVYAFRKFY